MAFQERGEGGETCQPLKQKTRILIVDDHELLRMALRTMIDNESDLEVCGEAGNEDEALRQVRETRPDLVLVDVSLNSGNDGIDLIKRIHAHDASVRVVVSSMHDEKRYGERALTAGAMAYVNKHDPARTVVDAIRRVLEGKMFFSEEFTQRVMQRAVHGQGNYDISPIEKLSNRELEVLGLIGEGLTTAAVAEQLHLSASTVETYRKRLKTKLDVSSGAELARRAAEWVLLKGM